MSLKQTVAPSPAKTREENVAQNVGHISRVYSEVLENLILPLLQERDRIFCLEFVCHYRSDSPHRYLNEEFFIGERFISEESVAKLGPEDMTSLQDGCMAEVIERVSNKVWEKIRWKTFQMITGLGFRFSFDSSGEPKFIIMRSLKLGGYHTKDQV